MQEMFVATCEDESESGVTFHFGYYILVGEMEVNGNFACESYGVKIVDMEHPSGAVSIPNITTSISRIDELMNLLTRNKATPANLRSILDDWL